VARAAASAAVQGITEKVELRAFPDVDRDLQERITLALSSWQYVDTDLHPSLQIKARVRLRMDAMSRRRLEEYHSSRRKAHTELAILTDRLTHFYKYVLHDVDTARAWWMDHHNDTVESWHVFESVMLPLVHHRDDPQSEYQRAAAVFATVLERLATDEDRRDMFVTMARTLLDHMGWHELAERFQPEPPAEQPGLSSDP
jgi:hypothetical protein